MSLFNLLVKETRDSLENDYDYELLSPLSTLFLLDIHLL